jgi:hypothetical protein
MPHNLLTNEFEHHIRKGFKHHMWGITTFIGMRLAETGVLSNADRGCLRANIR